MIIKKKVYEFNLENEVKYHLRKGWIWEEWHDTRTDCR